jgi:hypothetical protein
MDPDAASERSELVKAFAHRPDSGSWPSLPGGHDA